MTESDIQEQQHDQRLSDVDYSNSCADDDSKTLAEEVSTLPELFFTQAERSAEQTIASVCSPEEGVSTRYSWEEASKHVAMLAYFLRTKLDVRKEQRIAVFSSTRYEWLIADLAILSVGAVSVPVYHSLTPKEAGYILWNSDAQIVFAENQEQIDKLLTIDKEATHIPRTEGFRGGKVKLRVLSVFCFDEVKSDRFKARLFRFWDIVEGKHLGDKKLSEKSISDLTKSVAKSSSKLSRDAMASIVYTSGTTGPPKGVMQTHGNHLAMLSSVLRSGLVSDGKGLFLFLPLAHSFGRLLGYTPLASGGELIFPSIVNREASVFDAKQLFADVKASSPQIFPSVPRLFEKVMTGIIGKTGGKSGSLKSWFTQRLARWSLANYLILKRKRDSKGRLGPYNQFCFVIANGIVSRIRESVFGENLAYCISGGAPLDVSVGRFFASIGVEIYEGYGLTETTPAISANTPEYNKLGTVGRMFPCNEVKIAEADGEILVKGENIALGYFKMPNETKKVFADDGWFSTGDIGIVDAHGFLSITDRKKNIIVTAGGKNIAPALIEGRLKSSPYISQVFVYGDRKPYLTALITLEEENTQRWAKSKLTEDAPQDLQSLSNSNEVKELIHNEVSRLCEGFASYEQVKRFTVLDEDFSIENGLLSPTLKVKRKLVAKRYASQIQNLYRES